MVLSRKSVVPLLRRLALGEKGRMHVTGDTRSVPRLAVNVQFRDIRLRSGTAVDGMADVLERTLGAGHHRGVLRDSLMQVVTMRQLPGVAE